MTAGDMILAELIALRVATAALARELMIAHGSDAMHHCEAQALQFLDTAAIGHSPEVQARAREALGQLFSMADSA